MNHEELQSQIDKATKLLEEARMFHATSSYDESERCTWEVITALEAYAERDDLGEARDPSSQKYALIGLPAHAYNRLNTISMRRADYQIALHQAETASGFCERIDNRRRKADLLGNIGMIHANVSEEFVCALRTTPQPYPRGERATTEVREKALPTGEGLGGVSFSLAAR